MTWWLLVAAVWLVLAAITANGVGRAVAAADAHQPAPAGQFDRDVEQALMLANGGWNGVDDLAARRAR